jgi:hypothetical protein
MRAKVNSGASRRDAERAAPVAGPPLRGARCRAPCSSLSVRLPVLPPSLSTQYVDTRRKSDQWRSRTRAAARGADLGAESVKLRRRATQVRAREDLSSTAGARTHVALVLATPREHAGSGATSNAELDVGAHRRPGLDDVLGSTPHSVPPGGGASSIRQATYHRRTPGSPPCASYSRTCGVRAKCRQFSKARQSGLPLHAHGSPSMTERQLTILQVNDLHGYLEPHPEAFRGRGRFDYRTRGGLARIPSSTSSCRCVSRTYTMVR